MPYILQRATNIPQRLWYLLTWQHPCSDYRFVGYTSTILISYYKKGALLDSGLVTVEVLDSSELTAMFKKPVRDDSNSEAQRLILLQVSINSLWS